MKDADPVETVQRIPLGQVHPSPTNPRKKFDPAGLQELAESIKAQGVLQPVLLRVHPKLPLFDGKGKDLPTPYELIVGERRVRASKLAGLGDVPAIVRGLTDVEVLEVQAVENEQREDVSALERAAAYGALLERGRSIEQVAATVGKSAATIRDTQKLAQAPADVLAAVERGELSPATAILVARCPTAFLRERAAWCVLNGVQCRNAESFNNPAVKMKVEQWNRDQGPLSYRAARELIKTCVAVELKSAPFNRKALALLPAVGTCDDCPTRAGNMPELAADGIRGDVCMNPACYHRKVAAWRDMEALAAQESGKTVLSPAECEKLFRYDGELTYGTGYFDLAEQCGQNKGKRRRSYQQLVGDELAGEQVIAFDRHGRKHVLVPQEKAVPILKAKGIKAWAEVVHTRSGGQKSAAQKAEEAKQREQTRVRKLQLRAVLGAVVAAAEAAYGAQDKMAAVMRAAVDAELNRYSGALEDVSRRRGIKAARTFEQREALHTLADGMSPMQLFGLLAELLGYAEATAGGYYSGKKDRPILAALSIDKKAVEKRAVAEDKEAARRKGLDDAVQFVREQAGQAGKRRRPSANGSHAPASAAAGV